MSILDEIRQTGNIPSKSELPVQTTSSNNGDVQNVVVEPKVTTLTPLDIAKAQKISLTPEQRQDVDRVKQALDFMDAKSVQELDEGINQQLATFNSQMLQKAKLSEVGDMSPLIMDVVQNINKMDPSILRNADGSSKKGLWGFLGKTKNKIDLYRSQFETVEKHFDDIVVALKQDVEKQKEALQNMNQLYAINYQQYCDLKILLVAGREKLEEIYQNILPKLEQDAINSPDSYAVQTYQQAVNAAHRLEKKVDDMNALRLDTLQTATIIQIVESNALSQIESTTQTSNGAIQQWKRSVTIALTLRDQKNAAERDSMVRDINNKMRIKTSEMLGEVTIKVAENNERSIIDYSTLETVNKNLVETMQKVTEIQSNGRQRRVKERNDIIKLEDQLRQSVLENSKNQKAVHYNVNEQIMGQSTKNIPASRLSYS